MTTKPKKLAVINDLSGYGRCALSVSIPVISALGVQACPIPTAILSNHTGFPSEYKYDFTDHMKPYIERFDIYMGQPFSSRTNCAIVSFEDTLTVNFASCIIEADVERLFFRKLVEDGIRVKIESNRTFHEE